MQKKLVFTFLLVTLALFALGFVLAGITRDKGEEYSRIVLSQQSYDSKTLAAARGEIWDRNGTRLAMNERVYNMILDPKVMLSREDGAYKKPAIDALAEVYGYDRAELENLISENPESSYIRYKRQMPEEEKAKFEEYKEAFDEKMRKEGETERIKGVWFEAEYRRIYPYHSLASDVIGFSSDEGRKGNWGLEQFYNSYLAGTNGRVYGYLNDDVNYQSVTIPAEDGGTVISTIDFMVQSVVEKYVAEYVETVGCKNIGVIAMNPQNGEIYAMASKEQYDLNKPADLTRYYTQEQIDAMTEEEKTAAKNSIWRNFCISDTYEPGSVAKILTIASGLEEQKLRGNEHFICDGGQEVGKHWISCHKQSGHGDVDVTQALMTSCNDALMQMSFMMGKEVFCHYQQIFGIGQLTNIDLPGEASAAGLFYSEEKMGLVELATSSFGQSYNVSMIQMAAAISSVVNGGNFYEPHMVKQIINANGNVVKTIEPQLIRKTVSADTTAFINEALFQTVEAGTGVKAAIPGYEIGGKTGTAQKIPRSADTFVVSFLSTVPAHSPELLLYVVIDEPNVPKKENGAQAPTVTKKILTEILPYLNIYPTGELPEPEKPEELPGEETQPGETQPEENPDAETPEETSPVTVIDNEEVYEEGGAITDENIAPPEVDAE